MALSDHERKALDELEASFYDRDPKLARSLARGEYGPRRLTAAVGILSIIVGMLLVVLAIPTSSMLLGVFGFVLALSGSSFWIIRNYPSSTKPPASGQ